MEAIGVTTEAQRAEVEQFLEGMLAQGRIASRPRVILKDEANALASTGVAAGPVDPKVGKSVQVGPVKWTVTGVDENGVQAISPFGGTSYLTDEQIKALA